MSMTFIFIMHPHREKCEPSMTSNLEFLEV